MTNALKAKDGRVVTPSGATVRGRILRIVSPAPLYSLFKLLLKFDQLDSGGQTIKVHVLPPSPEVLARGYKTEWQIN